MDSATGGIAARGLSRTECVLSEVLAARTREHPDRVFAVFEDGVRWTYAEARRLATSTAAALQELGVSQGDHVLCWLPNGRHQVRTWFGTNHVGAVYVPVNTAYRGNLLEHVVRNSGARILVTCEPLLPYLAEVDLGAIEKVVVVGSARPADVTLPATVVAGAALDGDPEAFIPPSRPVEPWDVQAIIFTSGTTGPSKGVACSYTQLHTSAASAFRALLGSDDRYLVNLPLFHAAGVIGTLGMLDLGASVAVTSQFDTKYFWETVHHYGITSCTLLGVMATFLIKRGQGPADAANPLRVAYVVPLTDTAVGFAKRFDVDVYSMFNMTELSCPVISDKNPVTAGICGKPRPGVQARIADEHDRELEDGQVGELMLRSECPWEFAHEYHGMPEATARVWRNGWFHTGDAFRRDSDGTLHFVDRFKDVIRRRGENISSSEVEAEVREHVSVLDAAAVAVPSEDSEDEILVAVLPVADGHIDPEELITFLKRKMAHFMVPRYVRVLPELPMTPTEKVRKSVLQDEGVTPDTWDRVQAGIEIKRERIAI